MQNETKILRLNKNQFDWLQDQLILAIGNLYDDPFGCCDFPMGDEPSDMFANPEQQISDQHCFFRDFAAKLNIDFEDVVAKQTTAFERERIESFRKEAKSARRN